MSRTLFEKFNGFEPSSMRTNPLFERKCPTCGKQAQTKYWDEKSGHYVYAHKKQYEQTIRHTAKK